MPANKEKGSSAAEDAWAAEFAERVRRLRVNRFGTQRGSRSQTARVTGITASDWRGYEKGVMPSAEKLHRICETLQCDANWLLGLSEAPDPGVTSLQQRIIRSLIDVQEALHAFDGMFTDCLVHLRDTLTDPEIAQAQCFKLYAIAQRLAQLRQEIHQSETTEKGEP